MAKARAGTARTSSQQRIQLRACSGLRTGTAPIAPFPVRRRHHSREPRGNRRNVPGAQERREPVLVLAPLDHRQPREEETTADSAPQRRDRSHVGVVVRNQEIDARGGHDTSQRGGEAWTVRGGNQVVVVCGGGFQDESVGVAADDAKRRIAGTQAADQIVTGPGAGPGDEHTLPHTHLLLASEAGTGGVWNRGWALSIGNLRRRPVSRARCIESEARCWSRRSDSGRTRTR
jgi:hypothetical protein